MMRRHSGTLPITQRRGHSLACAGTRLQGEEASGKAKPVARPEPTKLGVSALQELIPACTSSTSYGMT
eukprot:4515911-Amphidinium_carterae.1